MDKMKFQTIIIVENIEDNTRNYFLYDFNVKSKLEFSDRLYQDIIIARNTIPSHIKVYYCPCFCNDRDDIIKNLEEGRNLHSITIDKSLTLPEKVLNVIKKYDIEQLDVNDNYINEH